MQTDRVGEIREGPPGVHLRAWYACRESVRNLGGPTGSTAETQVRNDLAQGIRLLSHGTGNPNQATGTVTGGLFPRKCSIRSGDAHS